MAFGRNRTPVLKALQDLEISGCKWKEVWRTLKLILDLNVSNPGWMTRRGVQQTQVTGSPINKDKLLRSEITQKQDSTGQRHS